MISREEYTKFTHVWCSHKWRHKRLGESFCEYFDIDDAELKEDFDYENVCKTIFERYIADESS